MEKSMNLSPTQLASLNSLELAFLGDSVYELNIRRGLILKGTRTADRLAKETQSYVNAGAQAKSLKRISLFLTEEEQKIVARGKNAKSKTSARNASPRDYAEATALESLFGYLELKENPKRIEELIRIILNEVGAQ